MANYVNQRCYVSLLDVLADIHGNHNVSALLFAISQAMLFVTPPSTSILLSKVTGTKMPGIDDEARPAFAIEPFSRTMVSPVFRSVAIG